MKSNKIIFISFIILTLNTMPRLFANVAVVESQYDRVERALKSKKIKFDMISFRDLEKKAVFKKYKSIFIPCGIENSITSNVNVMSRGTRIKSVALNTNFYEVNENKISENIKNYVENGGYLYVSGYSFKYLQKAFNVFKFFNNFPYMGIAGRIESNLKNDLYNFSLKDKMALYMTHSGWITIKSAGNASILADAKFKTPDGIKEGPISLIINKGKGEVLFTSYHSTVFSDFRRFNIYRVAAAELFKTLELKIKKWEQIENTKIADSIARGENFRKYRLKLLKGENSVYFLANTEYFQVDIFDEKMSLIESREIVTGLNIFNIESKNERDCIVKVYPSDRKRFEMFAIISTSGTKIFPYFKKVIITALTILSITIGAFIYKLFNSKYSGRWKK